VIRVVLADDHPVVREGLRGMLAAEPGIEPRPGPRPSRSRPATSRTWC
jgi:hypothetical protein